MAEKYRLEKQFLTNQTENLGSAHNDGELSLYDNHPADLGTALYDRTKDNALAEHSLKELAKINEALNAVHNNSYGNCLTCGAKIPYERLKAVPSTLHCVKHSISPEGEANRPIEEEMLRPAYYNDYANFDDQFVDEDDTFKQVARFGTSETPADLVGDYSSYEEMYDNDGTEI